MHWKNLQEKLDNLSDSDFLEVYANMTKRMRLLKGSPSSTLNAGEKIVLHLKDENLDVPATVLDVMAYGFKVLTDDGIEGHVSPGCAYTKLSEASEGDVVTWVSPSGPVKATLVKLMGSVCKILPCDQKHLKTVPVVQVMELTNN